MNLTPSFIRRRIEHRPNLLKIVDNIGWLLFDKVFRMGTGLVIGVWVARYLGAEQFGQLNFAIAYVGIVSTIAGLGMHSVVVRDIVRDSRAKEEILGSAATLQFIGGFFACALTVSSVFWLRLSIDSLTVTLVVILSLPMLFKFSEVAMYFFESQVESKYTVWVQNSSFLLFALIKILLIVKEGPLVAFAWIIFAEAIFIALLMLVILGWRGLIIHQLCFKMERAKQLLADSWPLFLSSMAVVIYMQVDQIMLGQMMGSRVVGVYTAATKISQVWYFIPMIIIASVFPSTLQVKQCSEQLYYERLQKTYDIMVLLSFAVALSMSFMSEKIVVLLYGSGYAAAGNVLAIHIWASVFVFLGVASSQWFLAENKQLLSLFRTVLGAVVNISLNLLLIPRFGSVGAAIATIFSYMTAAFFADYLHEETKKMFYMKLSSLNIISALMRLRCPKN